jgi:hypothetical protein
LLLALALLLEGSVSEPGGGLSVTESCSTVDLLQPFPAMGLS